MAIRKSSMTTMARPSKKPTELRRRDFPALLRRRTYSDGKPRPLLRGVLHGCVSAGLALAALALPLALAAGALPAARWWPLLGAVAGRGAGYGASAALHLVPFASAERATVALRLDLALISASIWGAVSPFARDRADWARTLAVSAAFASLNGELVRRQFAGHVGLNTPDGRSDAPRSLALAAQFVWTIAAIGRRQGFDAPWAAGVALYLAAFALSAEVTVAHEREPMSPRVPWHRAGRNGFHEDFHALLFAADAIYTAMGVRFLLRRG